jgi:flavodoxin
VVAAGGGLGYADHEAKPHPGRPSMDDRPRPPLAPLVFTVIGLAGAAATPARRRRPHATAGGPRTVDPACPGQPGNVRPPQGANAMRTLVIVESRFGNTARIADAIARGAAAAGEVRVVGAADPEAATLLAARPDLVLVGGPTEGRHTSRDLARAMEALAPAFRGLEAATFDTRFRGSDLLMGSAAKRIAGWLRRDGASVRAGESFYVGRFEPPAGERRGPQHVEVEAGEEARAESWAASVVALPERARVG